MRESKCTIQNLKTGLWFAARLLCAHAGAKAKRGARLHGPGGGGRREGVDTQRTSMPHRGGCSDTHNTMLWHNCFVICHLREVWKGPSPAAPGLAPGQGHFSFLSAAVGSSLEAPGASLGVELSS